MQAVRFSLRQIRREWRSGELRALAAALVISAAALAAVGAFSQRVSLALTQGANELLAADLVVASRQMPDDTWDDEARSRGLQTTRFIEFPTVVFSGDRSVLAQVKAVAPGYPLRGELSLSESPFGPGQPALGIPEPGEVWVDSRVVAELGMELGQPLEVGDSLLAVTRVIVLEPDAGGGLFNLAPRVMMRLDAVEAAGLIGPGSRVQYRYLIAGPTASVSEFQDWLTPRLDRGQYIQTLAESQRQIGRALDRAENFLVLAAITAVLLSGVAIVIAVRQFVSRHLDSVAILRCLGSRQRSLMLAFGLQLLWLGIPALLLGALLGYLAQSALITAMGELLPQDIPQAGLQPALTAVGTGFLALFGFGLPPLARLRDVPPVRVLNRQLGDVPARRFAADAAAAVFGLALIWWLSGDFKLGGAMAGATAVATAVFAAGAWALIRLVRRLARGRTIGWRYGVANLARANRGVLLQISGLGLGLMAIFLLGVIQKDLMAGWRDTIAPDTPNYFLINIQPHQVETAQTFFSQRSIATQGLFPIAITRLVAINDVKPDPDDFESPRARRRLEGNVNISWRGTLPAANTITAGQFDDPDIAGLQLSLQDEWAQRMGLELGDRVTFEAGGQQVTGTITSLRHIDWDSFQPNFFIMFANDVVADLPRTYITAVHVPEGRFSMMSELVRELPNVSVIDVGSILSRVRTIINRVSLTVQAVFAFTLFAGVVVLLAALSSGLTERIHEGAVMRTLGGSSRQLRAAVFSEFALIGAVAGVLSAVFALVTGAVLAREVFEIQYQVSWWLPPAGMLAGAVGIGITGLLGSRAVLRTPPMMTLHRAA